MRITALRAHSIRGIPRAWPDLLIGEKGLIVYGPNGVGKSSIIDALEFTLTDRSTLFSENRLGVSWDIGAAHVVDGQPDIAVELGHGPSTWEVRPSVNSATSDASVKAWLGAASSSSFVLRRHMLLRFISEEPRKRYELLAQFFNLGLYRNLEGELRSWAETVETQVSLQAASITKGENSLRLVFELPAVAEVTESNLFDKLNLLLAESGLPPSTTLDDVNLRKQTVNDALGGKDRSDRLVGLGSLKTQAQRLGRLSDFKEFFSVLYDAVQNLEAEMAERTHVVLLELLAEGKRAIEDEGLDSCPLCEQPIDSAAVLSRIEERLKIDERVRAARELVAQRRKAIEQPISNLKASMGSFRGDWATQMAIPLAESYSDTEALLGDWSLSLAASPSSAVIKDLIERSNVAVTSHRVALGQIDSLIASQGGGEQRRLLERLSGAIDSLANDWQSHISLVKKHNVFRNQKKILDRLLAHVIEARKHAVQATLEAVAKTANRLYEMIHPKECISASKLTVRSVGLASVNLSTSFYGRDENPLLHFSDSHLDTLGLCYFLALRKYEASKNPDFKVLILDDVLHSVDGAHRVRIAQLLRQEFADHQLIIATHDRHFYEALRKSLGSGGYAYEAISKWDIEHGPIRSDPSTDLGVITARERHPKLRHEDLSASGGRLFEWLLKQLTERLQIAVQARFKREHDIGSLWPPLCKKLKAHQQFEAINPKLAENIDVTAWVRNACGAHENSPDSPVTPDEVREFAGHLASLYHATHCEKCGSFLAKQADDGWRCDCGSLLSSSSVQ